MIGNRKDFIDLLMAALVTVLVSSAVGQTTQPTTSQPSEKGGESQGALQGTIEKAAVSDHEVTIDGRVVKYKATAANMPMKDETGKVKATVFFVAYERVKKNEALTQPTETATRPARPDLRDRPITFVFNGGPGAAAVWLHLGTAGPQCVQLSENGEPLPPPYRLVDNAWSWLDVTDLVFIDPVGTGFSRPAEGEKGEQFYGVKEDIGWVADFIRLYITKYDRWLSPMFLAGESYGTTRAAGMSEYLLERYGINLNGIMLISSVLDFATIQFGDNNDLPYPLYLPTYAALAWYHKMLPPDLQEDLRKTLKEVEQWSAATYTVALGHGGSLPADQRQTIVDRLARYTGLTRELIDRCNLRVPPWIFQKELLRSSRQLIGRFDGRMTGFDPDPTAQWPGYDPSLSQYLAIYSSTFNDYVRRTLKYDSILPYEVLSDKVRPWKYGEAGTGYLSVTDKLRSAMIMNPHLKILFASGYFDLATPYFATIHTFHHLDLPESLRSNITMNYYHGGHMMYHHHPSLVQLKADMAAFVRAAVTR